MKIQGDSQQPVNPAPPRSRPTPLPGAATGTPTPVPGSTSDRADVGATPSEIGRYVQILKAMNPVDTSKVESFKARIKDGSYQASASELGGPLSDLLDGEPTSDPQSGSSG
jgi:hypothetical protein